MKESTFHFGDIVENPWASVDNPTKYAVFIRYKTVNGQRCLHKTDGVKWWDTMRGPCDRGLVNKKVGTIWDTNFTSPVIVALIEDLKK